MLSRGNFAEFYGDEGRGRWSRVNQYHRQALQIALQRLFMTRTVDSRRLGEYCT